MAVRRSDELLQRRLAQLADRGGAAVGRSRWSAVQRAILLALAGIIVLVYFAGVAAGLWLVVGWFPAPISWLGVVALGVAFLARPRLGRVPRQAVPITHHPALSELCAELSSAAGAPAPERVVFTAGMHCELTTLGLRRTRVLTIGMPLWVAMTPRQRVAALAGEFVRRGSGDPNSGRLVGSATAIIDEAYAFCTPMRYEPLWIHSLSSRPHRLVGARMNPGWMMWLADQLMRVLMLGVRVVPSLLARALASLSWAGRSAAHETTDVRTVDLAGGDAVRDVLRLRAASAVLTGLAQRLANGMHSNDDPLELAVGGLRRAIEAGRPLADGAERIDPFIATRIASIAAMPKQVPGVVLTDATAAAIDRSFSSARTSASAALRVAGPDALHRPLELAV